jgi:hypothetical protein
MLAAGDLQPPVGYDDRWPLVAAVAVLVVVTYYALAWWLTRPPRPRRTRTSPDERRQLCLAALDRIEAAAASGDVAPREAHQQISHVVREFVTATSGQPAATMTLTALRDCGPAPLAELVAELYPPEFGPDDDEARRRLAPALARARELVSTWR